MRKAGAIQNNNNNNNNDTTYPTSDALNCTGCGSQKCNKDDINRSRSISMQRTGNMVGASALGHTNCFDDHQPVAKTQRNHIHRSRSKTVSTNLCDSSRCDLATVSITDPLRMSKRKTSQVRACLQTNVPQLDAIDRRSPYIDADHLNGNVLGTTQCTESTTVTTITPRIICRNRSRTSTKCTPSQTLCSKAIVGTTTCVAGTSVKRGKRTLSSTQIEREKSDEKNIKLKKHAVLRSLSPILVTTSARSSIKKIIATSNTKWF